MYHFWFSNGVEALNGGLFVSPGYGTHATRVIDSYELIFVTQGHLDMFEEETRFYIGKNQTLLLFPGKRHGGLLPFPSDANFYWVHFRLREGGRTGSSIHIPKISSVRDAELLTDLYCRFISDQESGVLDPVSSASLVALMLCEICKSDESARRAGSARAALARRVQRYIDDNYRTPISTSSIARELCYNADYLERAYRGCTGVSILTAIHQRRISESRSLLRMEGGKNINEIAFACGFANPGYFRRVFKRMTGLTPRQMRALYSRTHINAH